MVYDILLPSETDEYNCYIIIDVLGGYSADESHAVKELVGEKSE